MQYTTIKVASHNAIRHHIFFFSFFFSFSVVLLLSLCLSYMRQVFRKKDNLLPNSPVQLAYPMYVVGLAFASAPCAYYLLDRYSKWWWVEHGLRNCITKASDYNPCLCWQNIIKHIIMLKMKIKGSFTDLSFQSLFSPSSPLHRHSLFFKCVFLSPKPSVPLFHPQVEKSSCQKISMK